MAGLRPEEILNDEALQEVTEFFKNLPTRKRALWRWIFPEPDGAIAYPRSRAKKDIEANANWDYAHQIMSSSLADQGAISPHNRLSLVFKINPEQEKLWMRTGLTTQNRETSGKVPVVKNNMMDSIDIWVRMMEKAHNKNLLRKPRGLETIKVWGETATAKQREALSTILLTFQSHMTVARGGVTTTKLAFGPP